jgi:hypothetical protein
MRRTGFAAIEYAGKKGLPLNKAQDHIDDGPSGLSVAEAGPSPRSRRTRSGSTCPTAPTSASKTTGSRSAEAPRGPAPRPSP